jgi:hypothetical protein
MYDSDNKRTIKVVSRHEVIAMPPLCREMAEEVYNLELPSKGKLLQDATARYEQRQFREHKKAEKIRRQRAQLK